MTSSPLNPDERERAKEIVEELHSIIEGAKEREGNADE